RSPDVKWAIQGLRGFADQAQMAWLYFGDQAAGLACAEAARVALASRVDAQAELLAGVSRRAVRLDKRAGQRERHHDGVVGVTRNPQTRRVALFGYHKALGVEVGEHPPELT